MLKPQAAVVQAETDPGVVNGTIYYEPPVVLGHEGAGIVEAIPFDPYAIHAQITRSVSVRI